MLKDDIKLMIDNLPDNCSIEDIQYILYVRSKIQKGQVDISEGKLISHENVKKRLDQWTQS